MEKARRFALLFLQKISTLNGLFVLAAVIALIWAAAFLLFAYVWLPGFVAGEEIAVPDDLIGLPYKDAGERALDMGARVDYSKTAYQHSAEMPFGYIVSHTPRPGQKVKATRALAFTVSKGPEIVSAPGVVGYSEREAAFQIEAAGLRLGASAYAYSDALVEAGKVIAATPQSGNLVKSGSKVDLLVSLGPRRILVRMPNLIGKDIKEAEAILAERGLRIGEVKTGIDPSRPRRPIALSQEPAPGEMTYQGAFVRLTVNAAGGSAAGRLVVASHTVTGSPADYKQVRLVIEDDAGRHILIDERLQGGSALSFPRTVVGNARLLIYENDMERPIQRKRLP